ncbi:hypothetical protein BJV82DRAFT_621551 [Fennellomyces sp. T-0311]|nr:hypothetical protein BJV82DRAFT_621551 [Fennellomyces sp. T-0311]
MKLPLNTSSDMALHLLDYLTANDDELWSVLAFDKALVEKHPGIKKKQAHEYISQDVKTLKKHFSENRQLRNRVKQIEKDLNRGNSALDTFWKSLKTKYETAAMEKDVNTKAAEAASIGLAAKLIHENGEREVTASEPLESDDEQRAVAWPAADEFCETWIASETPWNASQDDGTELHVDPASDLTVDYHPLIDQEEYELKVTSHDSAVFAEKEGDLDRYSWKIQLSETVSCDVISELSKTREACFKLDPKSLSDVRILAINHIYYFAEDKSACITDYLPLMTQ